MSSPTKKDLAEMIGHWLDFYDIIWNAYDSYAKMADGFFGKAHETPPYPTEAMNRTKKLLEKIK